MNNKCCWRYDIEEDCYETGCGHQFRLDYSVWMNPECPMCKKPIDMSRVDSYFRNSSLAKV